MIPSSRFLTAAMLLVVILAITKATTATTTGAPSVDSCRTAGFDPYQLACTTCDLLPLDHQETCRSCCVAYKAMEKTSRRYHAAMLLHTHQAASYYPELSTMINEDWDELVRQKGSDRLVLKDISEMAYHRPCILWFQEPLSTKAVKSMNLVELQGLASDRVDLYGWKRDDVREMIKAIVQEGP
jgi:hypothetical protein